MKGKSKNNGTLVFHPAVVATGETAIRRLREVAKAHAMWSHPFLTRCAAGELGIGDVRALATQMYRFTREFTPLLATILAACPDEDVRAVIGENLYEELGEGDASKSHVELFRHFTRALGFDDDALEALPAEPETRRLIEVYLSLTEKYGYLAALGAVCFASEGIVSTLYTRLQKGIENAVVLTRDDLVFFDVHIQTDTGHAAALVKVLEPRLGDVGEVVGVVAAVLQAMDARRGFFDGVTRLAARLGTHSAGQAEVNSR